MANNFIQSLVQAARQEHEKHGLFASVTIAQAALESAWGKSTLAVQAHNLFGIKGSGPAGFIELPTWEVVNGKRVEIRAKFRRYNNVAECLADRSAILTSLSRYKPVLAARTPHEQARALQDCGWATDPTYAGKLMGIVLQYRLEQYDLPPGPFEDVPGNHWAAEAITAARDAGLLTGYPDGTFRPEAPVTRAELAVVLQRLRN